MTKFFEKELNDFLEIYMSRPIWDNSGGMKSPHLFGLYLWLKNNNPELIIESGVWKGLGTWLMRKICPHSEIISIDIDFSNLVYRDSHVRYYNKDIKNLNIKEISKNFSQEKTLVFFDDHQNFNDRIDFLIDANIKQIIFEDNYPLGKGDCVSPKKIMSFDKGDMLIDSSFYLTFEECEKIKSKIIKYEEFRPIFRDTMTRWGVPWNYPTPDAFLDESFKEKYKIFFDERFDYTWICYVEIK